MSTAVIYLSCLKKRDNVKKTGGVCLKENHPEVDLCLAQLEDKYCGLIGCDIFHWVLT